MLFIHNSFGLVSSSFDLTPYIIMPVNTDKERICLSLMEWLYEEMNLRLSLLKEFAVENIDELNKVLSHLSRDEVKKAMSRYEGILVNEIGQLPDIVVGIQCVSGYEISQCVSVNKFSHRYGDSYFPSLCKSLFKSMHIAGIYIIVEALARRESFVPDFIVNSIENSLIHSSDCNLPGSVFSKFMFHESFFFINTKKAIRKRICVPSIREEDIEKAVRERAPRTTCYWPYAMRFVDNS